MNYMSSQAWRFAAVGIASTMLHIALASSLVEVGHNAPGEANGIAFVMATLVSYWLNSIWTFEVPPALGSLSRFVLVAVIGLVVTVGIARGIERAGYHYLVGIAVVVMIVPVLTFVLHRLWTFRARSGSSNV